MKNFDRILPKWTGPVKIPLTYAQTLETKRDTAILNEFCLNEINSLSRSIQSIGQTTPCHVLKVTHGQYYIISGKRRFFALKRIRSSTLNAMVTDVSANSYKNLFLFQLSENAGHRKFNFFEQVYILRKLYEYNYQSKEIIDRFAHIIDIPPHESVLNSYDKLYSLNKAIWLSVARNEISLHQAAEIAKLSRMDRKLAYNIISRSKLNNREFSRILKLLDEVSIIKMLSTSQLDQKTGITHVLNNEKYNRREKGKKILEILLRERNPKLIQHESEYRSIVQKLKLPPSIKLVPPANFEGAQLHVSITCKSYNQMKNSIEKLNDLKTSNHFKRIFDFF